MLFQAFPYFDNQPEMYSTEDFRMVEGVRAKSQSLH